MTTLRPFRPQDLGPVYDLARSCFRDPFSPETYLRLYRDWPRGFLVAEEEGAGQDEPPARGRIVGFLVGSVTAVGDARILFLAVEPEFRRQGIGSSLLAAFTAQAAAMGLRAVTLEVWTENETAQAFYRRHGFRKAGRIPRYYRDGRDAYVLYKRLG